jgi:putative ABC transport system ATP-binding protein
MAAVIELNDVSKIYGFGDATTVALDEVSLNIEKGEFVAIMGPSGSGKSTLLHTIGLLDKPTHGVYNLENRNVSRIRSSRLARVRRDKIGFIFQSFNLLPRLNVIDNVALPLAYKGMPRTRRLRQASLMLDRVGLQDREFYMPKTLSGGQSQRVAIARALVNNPSIIIADEPTGNLDTLASRVVMELLAELHNTGNTILMVTHNPELTRYATRVLYMVDGAIVHDEKTKLGEVPARARTGGYAENITDEEAQLASISEFMKAIPEKPAPPRRIYKTAKPKRRRQTGKLQKSTRKTTRKRTTRTR